MDTSDSEHKPLSNHTTSTGAPSHDGTDDATNAGDTQIAAVTPPGPLRLEQQAEQKRNTEMSETTTKDQQNNTQQGESLLGDVDVNQNSDNPEIVERRNKAAAAAAAPEDPVSQGMVDSAQDTRLPNGGSQDDPELSDEEDDEASWECCGGNYDMPEEDSSDWETPVDVELEPVVQCHRSSKAAWSTVKAVIRLMPVPHSSVPWSQLAGHKGSFLAGPGNTVLKLRDHCEEKNLSMLMEEEPSCLYSSYVPHYHGPVKKQGKDYLRMQDLQREFSSPCVMDVKMGVRTYLEKELAKAEKEPTLRKDLYDKMVLVDPEAPRPEENEQKAITKTRYLKFRDDMSSTSSLGFRIEGIKTPKIASKDFKKTRTRDDVKKVFSDFVGDNSAALEKYVSLLQDVHKKQETSQFFHSHEMVGSSLLLLHDSSGKAGVWMIDFAKCSPLPQGKKVDHTSPWDPGNYEDGYWLGLDNLASIFQEMLDDK